MYKCIGLCDADLLDNGTRHPNLVLMKIAGFLFDNHILFELILDPKAKLERYEHVFMSRVFTFTNLPEFYTKAIGTPDEVKFHIGGTGFYANENNIREYRKKREEDFFRLDYDAYLNTFINHRGGRKDRGIDMARQMPYYHLYDAFVEKQVKAGYKKINIRIIRNIPSVSLLVVVSVIVRSVSINWKTRFADIQNLSGSLIMSVTKKVD